MPERLADNQSRPAFVNCAMNQGIARRVVCAILDASPATASEEPDALGKTGQDAALVGLELGKC